MVTSFRTRNPLDDFQSYSVHHIMLACRTTENARDFASPDPEKAAETLQAIGKAKSLGEEIKYGSGGVAFLVMDTRRFSQFTVENLKYEVLINGLSKGQSQANLATSIEMTILDSVGISFINFLQWLMDTKMRTNFDGMIFMLRTIFVGHTSDGKTETVQTVTIPMHLYKMEVDLNYARGIYACEFMPNFNFDVDHHARWLNINAVTSYFTGKENTLGALVQNFQNRLNAKSLEVYNKTSKALLRAGKLPKDSGTDFGRSVQYMITLPKGWAEMEFQGSAVSIMKEEVDFRAKAAAEASAEAAKKAKEAAPDQKSPAAQSTFTADPDMTITAVLDKIFSQVPQIKALAGEKVVEGNDRVIQFYKHFVSITSNESSFTVHVDVVVFRVPDVTTNSSKDVSANESQFYETDAVGVRRPKMSIEYDYIFSGKNLDVLNFDMKIQDLQMMLASNVAVSEGQMFGVSDSGQGDEKGGDAAAAARKKALLSSRPYDPILMPMVTDSELQNFSQYGNTSDTKIKQIIADTQTYTRNLSAFYAASPIMVNMTIKGNPAIMMMFNVNDMLPHTSAVTSLAGTGPTSGDQGESEKHRRALEQKILKDNKDEISKSDSGVFTVNKPLPDKSYATQPVFVKINIYGPNVDAGTNELVSGQDFATKVLYDNYYVIFKIVNTIERGVFTQQLEMWSHNVYGAGKIDPSSKNGKTPEKK